MLPVPQVRTELAFESLAIRFVVVPGHFRVTALDNATIVTASLTTGTGGGSGTFSRTSRWSMWPELETELSVSLNL